MGVQTSGKGERSLRRFACIAITFLSMVLTLSLHAASEDERRVKAGARLFRAILSADVDIESKADPTGALTIVVIGSQRDSFAELAVSVITPQSDGATVKGVPLRSVILSVDQLVAEPPSRYGGVFIAGRQHPADLQSIIEFASDQRVIAFSPFEGDVEKGILGGLSIEARVKPYVNQHALAASGVQLKEKFLKVAKFYQ